MRNLSARQLFLRNVAVALCVLSLAPAATAQMALPGAVAPAAEGSIAETFKKARRSEARGPSVAPKTPSDDAIVGKPLYLDGAKSAVEFQRTGDQTQVAKLTLAGDRISRSGESCRIEVSGTPLSLSLKESENGLRRYQVAFPACPFTFEVLDGAVLVENNGKACEIAAADCRADPAGLWGMGEAEFDPKRATDMLGQRARIEKSVRNDFRVLFDRIKKDTVLRKQLVREQAGFSSLREEICRSYAQESEYGYCALRVTEARALTLATQLVKGLKRPGGSDEAVAENDARGKGKAKSRVR